MWNYLSSMRRVTNQVVTWILRQDQNCNILTHCLFKVDGFCADEREKTMIVETKWKGPKSVFAPFYLSSSSSKLRKGLTCQKLFSKGESVVEWDDEFANFCDLSVVSKDACSYGPWIVSVNVLSVRKIFFFLVDCFVFISSIFFPFFKFIFVKWREMAKNLRQNYQF